MLMSQFMAPITVRKPEPFIAGEVVLEALLR
jgi:hypothetical protein